MERPLLAHRVAQRVNWNSFLPSLAGAVEAALRDGYDGWKKMLSTLPTKQAMQVHRVIMEVRNDRLKTLNVIEISSPLVDFSFLWSLHQQTTAVYSRGLKLVVVLDAAVGTLRQHFPSFSSNYLEYVWCI